MTSDIALLKRQLRRHAIKFLVRCDLMDRTGRAWPATISSMPDEFFIGLLLLTPHCDGGRKLCGALNKGDVVKYRLGLNIYEARVAAVGDRSGSIRLHAVDVSRNAIVPVLMLDDDNPRLRDTVQKHAR
jgi:hypothetical protein